MNAKDERDREKGRGWKGERKREREIREDSTTAVCALLLKDTNSADFNS